MIRLLFLVMLPTLASAGILYSGAVDTSLFNVTTFASGLRLPTDITPISGGALLISTTPSFGGSTGSLNYYSANGTPGPAVFTSSVTGVFTGTATLGSDVAVGTFQVGQGQNTINLLQPGATPTSPMNIVGTLQMSYPGGAWDHDTIGMAARPTPGIPGSYDLILNVGSELDNVATPAGDKVSLTGTGFSAAVSASLSGDSLYMVRIDTTGAQPTVTAVQQIATGIRNVYGMAFDAAGDLYFTDNAIDALPAGSSQPTPVDGAPPQADELNVIHAAQLGVGAPINFGFPDCYIQYGFGGVPAVPVGSGCVQPLAVIQPFTDSMGVQHEIIGPTDLAFAPANFPSPYNDGIFIGFTGGARPNEESGLVFYSFATGQVIPFIEQSSAPIDNILGVASTADALFISDFGTGNVFEIQGAVPEPSSGFLAGVALFAGLCIVKSLSCLKSNA